MCLVLFISSSAQPGGGGGLAIEGLYNPQLQKIDLLNDPALSIRSFILKGGKVYQETFLYDAFLEDNGKMRISRSNYGFGLPPTGDVDENGYGDRQSDQRLLIIYHTDTMVVDFMGIMGENGGGYTDQADTLVIQKGYFKYYRHKENPNSYIYVERQRLGKFLQCGLTPYTASQLSAEGYLQYNAVADISFLRKNELPASYYFKRAKWHLQHKRPDPALADIEKGIEKSNGAIDCEARYLLTEAYAIAGQYEKAIENISHAMDCQRTKWQEPWESRVQNYETRIALLTKLGMYDKALLDHDTILSISKHISQATIDKANYRDKYLHDYTGAKRDLLELVNTIPANHLNDHPQGTSEYADVYFTLAGVEYTMGEIPAAARHWLRAEEFGYSTSSSDGPVHFFDSIIRQHPEVAELYLCRALAQFKRGPYLGWADETNRCFEPSLDDINKAERAGMSDYRINMYRARVLTLLKRYNEVLTEINIAIAKNDTDPRCFLFRYEIRNNLGQTKWGDNSDADYQKYLELLKVWRWERF